DTTRSQTDDDALRFLTNGTTIAGLAWNAWTALQQPAGLFNGMQRVGPRWVLKGLTRWMRDAASLESTARWIYERSDLMRLRGDKTQRDVAELQRELVKPGSWFDTMVRAVSADTLTQDDVTKSYFYLIEQAQKVADIPTWLGAYEKAMATQT